MAVLIDSYCGLCCGSCEFRESMSCGGCIATGGRPFHGRCDVAECANAKKRPFCGDCADFPCNILKAYSFDPVHGDNGARIENVRRQKAHKVAEARAGVDPVGVCGHSCDHCFLGQWCGGCRSDYDCCSFAGACEGGTCPNKVCAAKKGLTDCAQCADMPACQKGYYGAADGWSAKAAAMFIARHGRDAFMRAMDDIDSDTALRDAGSLADALKLLKEHI